MEGLQNLLSDATSARSRELDSETSRWGQTFWDDNLARAGTEAQAVTANLNFKFTLKSLAS